MPDSEPRVPWHRDLGHHAIGSTSLQARSLPGRPVFISFILLKSRIVFANLVEVKGRELRIGTNAIVEITSVGLAASVEKSWRHLEVVNLG